LKKQTKKLALLLAALALSVGLVACGGGDDSSSTSVSSESSSSDNSEEAIGGTFEPLAGLPQPYENVTGEADLTRADGETTIAISLDGLVANTKYMAHLHTGGCGGEDPGGPHFKFDPSGGEEPPNEIHLMFTTNGDGSGKAKVTSDREVPEGEAGSVVVHTAGDAMSASAGTQQFASLLVHEGEEHNEPGHDGGGIQPLSAKIACAELEGGSTETAAEDASGSVPTIEVKNDEPVGGVQELEFDSGEEIRFRVSSDAAEEIHVHGYDVAKDVPAGGTVEFSFPAEIEGIFEVELEALGTQIAELRVNP
jgi:Cu-Zn family superoxide dismutase